jgi:N-glycosylase/DNA lyase
VASLPPMQLLEDDSVLEATLPVQGGARIVRVSAGRKGNGRIEVAGRKPSAKGLDELVATIKHVLRLDEDLSEFYEIAESDPELAWVTTGAGRMVRSASVFEEVIKTICTTNCTWSATERMVNALVEHLGVKAPGAPTEGWVGRAFPTPEVMATAGDDFYKGVAKAGYRAAYLRSVAASVADGDIDMEPWGRASRSDLPDDELEARLLALPGVGPYAAAHVMMMLGRYSRLILDSWTRPTYARIVGRKKVADSTIVRRFKPYGPYAGLAFWLVLTRSWVPEPA